MVYVLKQGKNKQQNKNYLHHSRRQYRLTFDLKVEA